MSKVLPFDHSQFEHFMHLKVREARFRLLEQLDVCQNSRIRFDAKEPPIEGEGRLVNYRFDSLSLLSQTFKDLLSALTEKSVSWASLSSIRHMEFMYSIRNAITHDGNSVINLWVEGRFYIGCDFVRIDQKKKIVVVKAPTIDIETLSLEFIHDLSQYLYTALLPFQKSQVFTKPLYGIDFFDLVIKHHAIPEFAKQLCEEIDPSTFETMKSDPLLETLSELETLIHICQEKLKIAKSIS